MGVDDQIDELLKKLSTLYDDSPHYLGEEYEKIQTHVLTAHMNSERAMELMMHIYFAIQIPLTDKHQSIGLSVALMKFNKNISFMSKWNFLSTKIGIDKTLLTALRKLNTYRNDFAHVNTFDIRGKYAFTDSKGREKVKQLLEHLIRTNTLINDWFSDSAIYKEFQSLFKHK